MNGATWMFAVLGLLLGGGSQAFASTIILDFESLSQNQNATSYLGGFGITVMTSPTQYLAGGDETVVYGGGVVDAPSGTKYIFLYDSATNNQAFPPSSFTLNFSTPLDSFGFSESAMLAPSILASWTATAYAGLGGAGAVLATATFSGSPATHPTLNYTLNGSGIQSVRFDQNASPAAGFYVGNFDNFVLTSSAAVPEPASLAIWGGVGLFGLAIGGRHKRKNMAEPPAPVT